MIWTNLSETAQLEQILEAMPGDILIFKHSFRCSISAAIKNRLEKGQLQDHFKVFMIDVVESRPTSLYLAEKANVVHQSPQVLLFRNGYCYFHASHFDITQHTILAAKPEG
ncbi:MAG TPA: bacillithiol system redox-active protein YtxJ [Saprospiraceae bacterium]|nr:bacillithiol system redox-active protein YtxJ [Saprospiraceae bacterium]